MNLICLLLSLCLLGGCSEKVSDADQAVKLLEGDILEKAAGEDWRSGEWEGLGGPSAKLGLAEENENSQGEYTTFSVVTQV